MKKNFIIANIILVVFIVIIGICAWPIYDYGGHSLALWHHIGVMSLWWFFGLVFVNGFGIAIIGLIGSDEHSTY